MKGDQRGHPLPISVALDLHQNLMSSSCAHCSTPRTSVMTEKQVSPQLSWQRNREGYRLCPTRSLKPFFLNRFFLVCRWAFFSSANYATAKHVAYINTDLKKIQFYSFIHFFILCRSPKEIKVTDMLLKVTQSALETGTFTIQVSKNPVS